MPENKRSPAADAVGGGEWIDLLETGEIEIEGRMPWSSNATFLVSVESPAASGRAIYKPLRGEYPLWDFPEGIYRYEVAAYELSEALELAIVPETIARVEAPLGTGSLQRFIDADFEQHYFTLVEQASHLEQLRVIAGFDLLLNSADRKGGHLLIDDRAHIYGIDNGLCFHPQPKLRTVMWDFVGEPVPEPILAGSASLLREFPEKLGALLSKNEHAALLARARAILDEPVFPAPDLGGRPYPWPRI